jgi:hypothetical protein
MPLAGVAASGIGPGVTMKPGPVVLALAALSLAQPTRADEPTRPGGPAAAPFRQPGDGATIGQTPARGGPQRYRPDRFAGRAGKYYQLVWGVDSLSVKLVESGEVVRFSYRVLDPARAVSLNDKRNEPSLIDPRAGVKLVVPAMEKIGALRQTGTPVAGKAYWMAFSNKGRPVKKGDRVDVVIGQFRAPGLVVD